jgi:dihydrofolate reductase
LRKVVVSQFVTVDGVIEDPGGSEGMDRGGWAFKYDRGPEGNQFKLDEVMEAGALLLGRVTYEGFAEAWPSRKDEAGFADKFNSMPKYVVSNTLKDPEWNNSTVIDGDVAEEVAKLKEEDGGPLLVNGSRQLGDYLLEHDLVDEYRLMVFPVVLGAGKRLFGDTSDMKSLRLAETKPAGECVVLIYERGRAGPVHRAGKRGAARRGRPSRATRPARTQRPRLLRRARRAGDAGARQRHV